MPYSLNDFSIKTIAPVSTLFGSRRRLMFKICVACPDRTILQQLDAMLSQAGEISVRRLTSSPSEAELDRYLRFHAPHAILISSSCGNQLMDLIAHIRRTYPNLQVGVVCADRKATDLVPFMRAGVRETIFLPLHQHEVEEAVDRLRAHAAGLDAIPKTGEVLCFLPAKPGVGASTIVVNTAAAFARKGAAKVLLVDADLGSGMVRFMLQIEHERSIRDAAKRAADLDENLWPQLITKVSDGLDVLHSGRISPAATIDPEALLGLLDFWRRTYDVVCFDLSGNLDKFSLDLMREANKIFLVGTSELAALHLLREKAQILKASEIADRVYAIHNRKSFNEDLSTEQIEELIDLSIYRVFRNSYAETKVANREGRAVRAESALGLEFSAFAAQLRGEPARPRKRSAFRDMLSLWRKGPRVAKPLMQKGLGLNGRLMPDAAGHTLAVKTQEIEG